MNESFNAERAEALLREWTASESLVKHGLSVARCTESYGVREAARLGLGGEQAVRFAELYRCTGLLHDFDYERHPTPAEHPFVGVAYLREQGWPEEMLHAILAHADYSGVLAGDAPGPRTVCLGRAGGLSDRVRAGEAVQVDCRGGGGRGEEEDEGQGRLPAR